MEVSRQPVAPNRTASIRILTALAILSLCAACGGIQPTPDLGIDVPAGYEVELYASGLDGPTQMIIGSDGRLWVAQLAGSEGAGTGQVIALDSGNPAQREILLEHLYKPTGIALLNGAVWIAAGRDLLRASLDAQGKPGTPAAILENLPFNGRSNGTLTDAPDGHLIYETSGSRSGNVAVEGSASLWSLDPAKPSEPLRLATGMKNAFAHTFDRQGRLWATDIADDPVNGGPPPDELNLIKPGANYGWPACYGEKVPATNYGGTEASCGDTQPTVTTFPARSTPTSVIVSPWEEAVLLVALWGPTEPSVVRIHWVESQGKVTADDVSPFLTGLAHPQSLLALADGSVLVSDFESGSIYRISQP
jgi:glucose/arabinose dehydrogenase